MDKCSQYAGNQYCNLHKSNVASAYCGDICEHRPKEDKVTSSDCSKNKDVLGK